MKRVTTDKGTFCIRQAVKADLEYILPSWMQTYEKSPEFDQPGVVRDEYFRHTHLILDELLARASQAGSLYVCHEEGAPHIIRGYLCAEVFKKPYHVAYLHWVQVKGKQWGQGVASALIDTFKRDFDIQENQNILYTFSSKAMTLGKLSKLARSRHNLLYWPWFKFTSMEPGWEVG